MKKFVLLVALALGGCGTAVPASVNTGLTNASNATAQAAAGAATAQAAIPALCAQVSNLTLQVAQSGLTGSKLSAALTAGQAKYNTYCGPIAVDLGIAAQVAASLTAIINEIQILVNQPAP